MVKWPLCIIKHHAMKIYGGLTICGGGWSNSHPSHQPSTINYFLKKNHFFCSLITLLVWRPYRILEKKCRGYKNLSLKSVKHFEMIQVSKWGRKKGVSFGYAQLMVGNERYWDAFLGWPINTTCAQGRPSGFPSPASFTSQCESVPGEVWTVQQNAEFVSWYAELKSVVTVQRKWWKLFAGEKAPGDKTLNRWLKQFKETGSVVNQKTSGRPGKTEENADCIDSPV
jgi:hypothetical protein